MCTQINGTPPRLYVYLTGSPSIHSVIFDRNSTTLIRTSTGGPPTTVTWRKNNTPVNLSIYEGCIQSVDWTGGLDYWTDQFSLENAGMLHNVSKAPQQ